jgi:uncharacterized protein
VAQTSIKTYEFSNSSINTLGSDSQEFNWPVIYQIYDNTSLYVGETTNLKSRMKQHIQNSEKVTLRKFSVIFDKSFNKSVALDLGSQLIQWYSGEGKYTMLNKNDGLVDRDYFMQEEYRKQFPLIWEELRTAKLAEKTDQEIENSGLFKFSPYKKLNEDQLKVVYEVLTDLDEAFKYDDGTISVIGGAEGTGKTIVLMYLAKLIRDIQDLNVENDEGEYSDSYFELFFKEPFNARFMNKTLALVIPSVSLRGSMAKILKGISNMGAHIELLSPIEFGSSNKNYDITFVDELPVSSYDGRRTYRRTERA